MSNMAPGVALFCVRVLDRFYLRVSNTFAQVGRARGGEKWTGLARACPLSATTVIPSTICSSNYLSLAIHMYKYIFYKEINADFL